MDEPEQPEEKEYEEIVLRDRPQKFVSEDEIRKKRAIREKLGVAEEEYTAKSLAEQLSENKRKEDAEYLEKNRERIQRAKQEELEFYEYLNSTETARSFKVQQEFEAEMKRLQKERAGKVISVTHESPLEAVLGPNTIVEHQNKPKSLTGGITITVKKVKQRKTKKHTKKDEKANEEKEELNDREASPQNRKNGLSLLSGYDSNSD